MPVINELINKGFDLHQSGKLAEAEEAYREALAFDSDNAEVYNLMSVLKLQQNDADDAVEWAKKAILLKPNEYFYETLFQAYIRCGAYDRITECEKEILQKYPKNFSLLFNVGLAYRNLNNNKKAIEFYEKAVKVDVKTHSR